MARVHYAVYRNGRTYGVYRQPATDGTGQELVEGGFFSRKAAEKCRDSWQGKNSFGTVGGCETHNKVNCDRCKEPR